VSGKEQAAGGGQAINRPPRPNQSKEFTSLLTA
jgi:hypothetical protein